MCQMHCSWHNYPKFTVTCVTCLFGRPTTRWSASGLLRLSPTTELRNKHVTWLGIFCSCGTLFVYVVVLIFSLLFCCCAFVCVVSFCCQFSGIWLLSSLYFAYSIIHGCAVVCTTYRALLHSDCYPLTIRSCHVWKSYIATWPYGERISSQVTLGSVAQNFFFFFNHRPSPSCSVWTYR